MSQAGSAALKLRSIYPEQNSGYWSSGLFSCCSTIKTPQGQELGGYGLCLKGFCCTCMLIGDNSEYFGDNEGVCFAGQGNGIKACLCCCAARVSAV